MSDQSLHDRGLDLQRLDRLTGKRPDVDPKRIAIMGQSFGGYWAVKTAHVEARRLRASIVWGGGVHYFFRKTGCAHRPMRKVI